MVTIPNLRTFINKQMSIHCPNLTTVTRLAGKDENGKQIILVKWKGELGREFFEVMHSIQELHPEVILKYQIHI
jgi:hypothetical protein